MVKKVKKHPTITETIANVLKDYGYNESDALETFGLLLMTGNLDLASKYSDLKKQQSNHKNMIQIKEKELMQLNKELKEIDMQLEIIEKQKANHDITNTDDFKQAKEKVESLLCMPELQYKHSKRITIKKIELQEIIDIADEFNVPCDLILQNINQDDIRKYVKNGKFLKLGGYTFSKK